MKTSGRSKTVNRITGRLGRQILALVTIDTKVWDMYIFGKIKTKYKMNNIFEMVYTS